MKQLTLIGFMGSGKSTTGQMLSKELGIPLLELDQMIEEETKMSIPDIFDLKGEAYFRELETAVLTKALNSIGVIATGGGVLTNNKNVNQLKSTNNVIYLKGEASTLIERIKNDSINKRPLADTSTELEITKRLENRVSQYEEVADIIIEIENKSISEITLEIMNQLEEMKE
ncbi:shikimate kinase [Vagococcus carniphilus]|uniref:Shikimate kinase n=1 Tax=Vagococcus carniphilus TaxID=218144 RepID=A0AAW8U644_9ENTE|nr:shikimate kinase [Vagococcus carniphilus]MDT2835016.1 shikimate kinase [Vagococcus carniphilus]